MYKNRFVLFLGDPDQVWILAKPIADYLEFYETKYLRLIVTVQNIKNINGSCVGNFLPTRLPFETQSLFINEQGLYELITKSNKPKARDFQYWIHNEVLPKLRKSGNFEQFGPLNDAIHLKSHGSIWCHF